MPKAELMKYVVRTGESETKFQTPFNWAKYSNDGLKVNTAAKFP
jgi:hypothetical protein